MLKAILFDLGNTLVDYGALGRPIWREGLERAYGHLQKHGVSGLPNISTFTSLALQVLERYEGAEEHRVVPIEVRLKALLAGVGEELDESTMPSAIEELISPMLAEGCLNEEAIPVLQSLRGRGLKLGLVSNLP